MWKDIEGHEGIYQAHPEGRIRSLTHKKKMYRAKTDTTYYQTFNGTELIAHPNSKGYLRVNLRGKVKFVHRLVAKTFLESVEDKPYVNHKDGNVLNNNIDNLEWMTNSENIKHAYAKGHAVSSKGEAHHGAKLTEKEVVWILTNYVKGSKEFGRKPLARKFGVSHQTIKNIIDRKKWKHIQL